MALRRRIRRCHELHQLLLPFCDNDLDRICRLHCHRLNDKTCIQTFTHSCKAQALLRYDPGVAFSEALQITVEVDRILAFFSIQSLCNVCKNLTVADAIRKCTLMTVRDAADCCRAKLGHCQLQLGCRA